MNATSIAVVMLSVEVITLPVRERVVGGYYLEIVPNRR